MNIQILKRYSHQGLCRAIDIFNYPHEFVTSTRLLGFRFLLQYRRMDTYIAPRKTEIIKQMKEMIDTYYNQGTPETNAVLMELVDMLMDYSRADGTILLAYLREQGLVANYVHPIAHNDGLEFTVYGDSQSVHNNEISASTRRAAKYLADNFSPKFINGMERTRHYERVKKELVQRYGKTASAVIDRIYRDNAHFNIGYTVDQVLMAVLGWINSERKRYGNKQPSEVFPVEEVLNRLGEELAEMANYCSSGLLGRLVNSIQGFTDGDKRLEIRISNREQIKTVVYSHLNKALQECEDEDIMDGMMTGTKKFLTFVRKEIANNIEKWRKEYADDEDNNFTKQVTEVVNEYTNVRTYA